MLENENQNDSEDLSEENIDAIIASGDPDAIDKAMAQVSLLDNESDVVEQSTIASSSELPNVDIDTKTNEPDKSAVIASQSEEGIGGVSTKNGEGIIPYEVLSQTREQLNLAQQASEADQSEIDLLKGQLNEQARLLEINKTQFEANNLDVPVLPEHEKINYESLSDYGDIGNDVRIVAQQVEQLAKQNAALQEQLSSQAGVKAPVTDSPVVLDETFAAIEANPVLKQLFNDPATKKQVVAIDNKLRGTHKHLSLSERFDLVVSTHNQNVDALINTKTPKQSAVPASMSDVGGETLQPEVSGFDQLVSASDSSQAKTLDGMSAAQLDNLLNTLG